MPHIKIILKVIKKKKYIYNFEKLTFQEVKSSSGLKLKKALFFIFSPVIVLILAIYSIGFYIEAPKTMLLSRQSDLLSQELISLGEMFDSLSYVLVNYYYKNDNSFRAILEIDTIPMTIREAGTGGTEQNFNIRNFGNSTLLVDLAKKIDKINRQLKIKEDSYNEISENLIIWLEQIKSIPSIMPVSINDLIMISSEFGVRVDPFSQEQANHNGFDYVAPSGTNVYASGNGIVTFLNYSRKGYGNEVIINHNFGFSTRYAHLKEILVEQGDSIKRGQVIGLVGTTGRSTGPHLHYEVRFLNQPVNPYFYYSDNISGEEYEIMVRNNNSKD